MHHTYLLACTIEGRRYTFKVHRGDYGPRFRWLCRDGRFETVVLYRDDRLYHSWRRSEPVPMLLEERGARAA